jgi:hypothetical protein
LQIFGDVGSGSDSEDDEDEALDSPPAAAAAQMFSEFEQPAREFADVSDEEVRWHGAPLPIRRSSFLFRFCSSLFSKCLRATPCLD